MCSYKEDGISGYDSMNLAYQKFCVHKKLLQERDRKIYTAMQPLLDDVEMFMKTAMREIEKQEVKLATQIEKQKEQNVYGEIGDITIIPNFDRKNKYKVTLHNNQFVIIDDRHEAEKLSKNIKQMKNII